MSDFSHSTDRVDWTIIKECPEDESHFSVEASATKTTSTPEDFPFKECPECGAELATISKQSPSEILK